MKKILLILVLTLVTGCSSSNDLKLKQATLSNDNSINIIFNKSSKNYISNLKFENDGDNYKWDFGTKNDQIEKAFFISESGKIMENIWIEDPTSGNLQLIIRENNKEDIRDLYFISFVDDSVCISENNNNNCQISLDIKND